MAAPTRAITLLLEARSPSMPVLPAFDVDDVGLLIQCTLTVAAWVLAGSTFTLVCSKLGALDLVFPMTGPVGSVVTRTVAANDFTAGSYICEVRAVQGGLSVGSEPFRMTVEP